MLILSTNVDQKSGDKWQSKTQFLVIIGLCLSIVFDCRLSGVYWIYEKTCHVWGQFCLLYSTPALNYNQAESVHISFIENY